MRDAETVLGIIQERGRQGLPLEDIYRQLFNVDLYLRAYAHLYQNQGAMTPGVSGETVDGMSIAKIEKLIEQLRSESYRWTPVKRVYIPKKNGKLRSLGIPSWSDKLLQEVIRLILEAYYEPQFNEHSHGFRPKHGCHTALQEIAATWTGTKWFIEGDIAQFFDTIDFEVLLQILGEKLHDNRFLRLIENLLKAGYMENLKQHQTLSGTPQGSGVSPILSNIYLDRLDTFVEKVLIPEYNRGQNRSHYKPYSDKNARVKFLQKKGELKEARKLHVQVQNMPSRDPLDPNYRRLRYVRYADDVLFGFAGPKQEAEEIKAKLADFLKTTLKLELSAEKTLITHAPTQAARFLGYDITVMQANDRHDHRGRRIINGRIGLRVPAEVVEKLCRRYMRDGKPSHRNELFRDEDFSIITQYGAEYRGIVQYYLLAQNVGWLWKLHWVMKTSLLRTLASKYKSTLMQMARKYTTTISTEHGTIQCVQVTVERESQGKKPLVARFGGLHLRPQKRAIVLDLNPFVILSHNRTEILKRLLADTCELCGVTEKIEVHHIRKLADLKKNGKQQVPGWVERMSARRRKTLMVCSKCHDEIHAGKI